MSTSKTRTPDELDTTATEDLYCYNCGADLLEPNFNRCCTYCAYILNAEAEYDRRREEG